MPPLRSSAHEAMYEYVLESARKAYGLNQDGIHGIRHWLRVERIGLQLARTSGADVVVVRLFARLHDCQRWDDGRDPLHGHRAAEFAERLFRTDALSISPSRVRLLTDAIRGHNDGRLSSDPTVGTCWDADRLDLGRVGVNPDPRFLSTPAAKDPALLTWVEEMQHQDGDAYNPNLYWETEHDAR